MKASPIILSKCGTGGWCSFHNHLVGSSNPSTIFACWFQSEGPEAPVFGSFVIIKFSLPPYLQCTVTCHLSVWIYSQWHNVKYKCHWHIWYTILFTANLDYYKLLWHVEKLHGINFPCDAVCHMFAPRKWCSKARTQ